MRVNGKDFTWEGTLAELLTAQGYNQERVAVERNGWLVLKTEYESTVLKPEDVLEIVHFVGGG